MVWVGGRGLGSGEPASARFVSLPRTRAARVRRILVDAGLTSAPIRSKTAIGKTSETDIPRAL